MTSHLFHSPQSGFPYWYGFFVEVVQIRVWDCVLHHALLICIYSNDGSMTQDWTLKACWHSDHITAAQGSGCCGNPVRTVLKLGQFTPNWDGLAFERRTKNNKWTSPVVTIFLADVRLSAGLPWSQHSSSWLVGACPQLVGHSSVGHPDQATSTLLRAQVWYIFINH